MLSRNQKYLARMMFRVLVRTGDDRQFARLFSGIMSRVEPELRRLGIASCGGRGNGDVYLSRQGSSYLLYSADAIKANLQGARKLADTVVYFGGREPLRSLFVVCNDRFEGRPVELCELLGNLSSSFPGVYFDSLPLDELEALFAALSDDDTIEVIGELPGFSRQPAPTLDELNAILNNLASLPEPNRYEPPLFMDGLSRRLQPFCDAAVEMPAISDELQHELRRGVRALVRRGRSLKPAGESDDWVFCYALQHLRGHVNALTSTALCSLIFAVPEPPVAIEAAG